MVSWLDVVALLFAFFLFRFVYSRHVYWVVTVCIGVLRFVVDTSLFEFIGLIPYVTKKTKINILYYIIYIYIYVCMYI